MINVGDTAAVFYAVRRDDAFRQSKRVSRSSRPARRSRSAVRRRTTAAAGYCGDRNNANDGYINWQRFPSMKKFQDNLRANLTAQEGGKVQVVYRLGEVYLIAAEADVGLGNAAEAATFVNVLHQRAASPAHKNDYNVTAGADDARLHHGRA